MITPMQLKAVFPACRNPGVWVRAILQIAPQFDITTDARLLMFIAQCGYESGSFNVLRELLSYSTVDKLRAAFPHEMTSDDVAQRFVMNPVGLGNYVYANRNGNGDVASGDGYKYRGGGLIELTGKGNYQRVGEAIGVDLLQRPNQIIIEPIAAKTAGFFWKQNDLNAAADAGDFDYTTRRINGSAMEGADERRLLWQKLVKAVGSATPEAAAAAVRRAAPPVIDGLADFNLNSPRSVNAFNT
jgi:putative chitinase